MTEPRDTRTARLAATLYLLSGVAALVYQVAWQRILALYTGVGLYSVAVIVAAFLAGLGVGSHLGGLWSARLGRRAALLRFALVEMAVGAFGIASPWVYYDWLYPVAAHLPVPSLPAALVHFAALGPPTLLMGLSLPLLTRAVVPGVREAGRAVGLLYALNLLGAGLGALATPWLLVPHLGIRGALVGAGLASTLVGLGGFALLARVRDDPVPRPEAVAAGEPATDPLAGGPPLAHWLGLYGLSGFVALSLEIVWFRVLDVAVKSTAFTFGTVLAVYLLGSAAGCFAAIALLDRIERPLRAFLLVQCGMLAATAGGLLLLARGLPGESFYVAYWRGYGFFALGHATDATALTRLYVLLPLLLFGLPTALMGFSFPVLQRAVHDDVRDSGRKVGLLQAANIAGCVAGSLLVGLLSVEVLGTAATARALVLAGVAFALLGWRRYGRLFTVPLVAIVALASLLPDGEALWRRLHGLGGETRALFDEDATGVVAVTEEAPGERWRYRLSINGKGNSWLPYGGVHTAFGALPALVHPLPRRVAIVGLGSGDTAWAAACRRETEAVTVVELSSPQPRILRRLLDLEPLPDLARFLDDPRVRVRIADGRQVLQSEDETYDLVEADPIWPAAAYSGNLYSREFYTIVARRLRPGGVACTWAPTPRVRASFTSVFPHVLVEGGGSILVGSLAPLPPDAEAWLARLDAATAYLGRGRARAVRERLLRLAPGGPLAGAAENRDLDPRDEFAAPGR
ncbi:MAG TPA: fused MFS/spermidine synthase, partial [Vicinamibacteria bacterium]